MRKKKSRRAVQSAALAEEAETESDNGGEVSGKAAGKAAGLEAREAEERKGIEEAESGGEIVLEAAEIG